jgi:predicted RNase H-like nuclease (RuvC/YqgF family)
MKLLGYILTFAIMIASIILLVVAVAVYGQQKNWKTAYEQLKTKSAAAETAAEDARTQYLNENSRLQAEQSAAQQDVARLETEREALARDNSGLQKQVDDLTQANRTAAANVQSTQRNNEALATEVAELRKSIRDNEQARDQAFAQTLRATSDLHTTAGQLQELQEKDKQLVEQLADVTMKAKTAGVSLAGEVTTPVRGVVSKTQRENGVQLIEISVGSDDGVRKGSTVEIFRGDRYLGRAEILRTDPDRAVGRVMREFQQGQIQEGDNVATKLRIS